MRNYLTLLFLLLYVHGNAQVLRDDTPLQEVVLFKELHMLLPESVLPDSLDEEKREFIALFEDLGKRKLRNREGTLSINIDQRDGSVSRKSVKNLQERFARNLYRGTIYRNEEMTINGVDIFILDFIGYDNGSKNPSSILFLSIFSPSHWYSFTLKYPEEDFDYSDAIKEEMIYSIRIEESP